MSAPNQPYPTRAQTEDAVARHVSRGKVGFYRKYGVDVVMGERAGARFHDAFSDRAWINCHCNGGVFNLGHRHPAIVEAMHTALETLDIGNHHFVSGVCCCGFAGWIAGGNVPFAVERIRFCCRATSSATCRRVRARIRCAVSSLHDRHVDRCGIGLHRRIAACREQRRREG